MSNKVEEENNLDRPDLEDLQDIKVLLGTVSPVVSPFSCIHSYPAIPTKKQNVLRLLPLLTTVNK